MRSLVVGLLGVVLGVGAAQAGECQPVGAELVAVGRHNAARPDLIGRTFKITRITSTATRKLYAFTALVEGGGERFFVDKVANFRGLPTDWIDSRAVSDAEIRPVGWGKRSAEAEEFVPYTGTFDIEDGPLANLTLTAKPCS